MLYIKRRTQAENFQWNLLVSIQLRMDSGLGVEDNRDWDTSIFFCQKQLNLSDTHCIITIFTQWCGLPLWLTHQSCTACQRPPLWVSGRLTVAKTATIFPCDRFLSSFLLYHRFFCLIGRRADLLLCLFSLCDSASAGTLSQRYHNAKCGESDIAGDSAPLPIFPMVWFGPLLRSHISITAQIFPLRHIS